MYAGMGRQLFRECLQFRDRIVSYQQICDSLGLPSVVHLISDTSHLTEPTIVQWQLAIVFLELALADLWMSWGVKPDLLIGHSLGEYSALCVSGVLSVSDTFLLVGNRSSILQRTCRPSVYAMLAISESSQKVKQVCSTEGLASCEISCKNAPAQTVVSGTVDDLKQLENRLTATGIKSTFLRIQYGFHSAQVDPILDEFEKSAAGIPFSKPKVPIASTLIGKVVSDAGTFSSHYLARQAREPVDFVGALQICATNGKVDGQSMYIEIGPEALCLGMIRSTLSLPSTRLLPTIRSNEENWKTISATVSSGYLAKLSIDWKAYHHEYLDALRLLDLPPYAFDLKNYWTPFKQESLGPGNLTTTTTTTTPQAPTSPMTTCLQYVVDESFEGDSGYAIFVSYTSEPQFYRLIQGHLVDGVALCPASVFCDMAFTAAKYVYSKTNSSDSQAEMYLESLEITHPIIVSKIDKTQKVEVKATKTAHKNSIRVSFSSPLNGGQSHENGSCHVRFSPQGERRKGFDRTFHLVKKRAASIQNTALAGGGHRLLKPYVYKLFSSLVTYGVSYQGIEEAFLDNGYRESTARIQLKACPDTGHFTYNPYWLDNLVHLAGFLLNGDVTKPDDIGYIAIGLDELHIMEELAETEHYTCYVSVQDSPDKKDLLVGDAYVFTGEKLVALCAGMCFQRMHKKILATVLGKGASTTTGTTHSRQTPAVTKRSHETPPVEPNSSVTGPAVGSEGQTGGSKTSKQNDDIADRLLSIVTSESGFPAEEISLSSAFADMGVDSLMSISITSAAKSQLGLDLPASFFINNPTVKDLRQELGGAMEAEDDVSTTPSSASNEMISTESDSLTEESSPDEWGVQKGTTSATPPSMPQSSTRGLSPAYEPEPQEPQEAQAPNPKARVVLLQGRSSSTEPALFLATDGAGSATAYIHIPPLPNGRRMYALESPFLSDPLKFSCGVEDFCSLYVAAIRESQPHGPYHVGGWSAGAIYAYEIARQLSEMGEKIQFLFLIDMRVPRPMPDALEPTMELIEQAGLVTGIRRSGQLVEEASTELKQHLVSTVKALTRYQPKPMNTARRPLHSFMVWAKRGISDETTAKFKGVDKGKIDADTTEANVMEDEETGLKGWFFAKRKVFGPNGWDEMVGEIECHAIDADHFSMVQPPGVSSSIHQSSHAISIMY